MPVTHRELPGLYWDHEKQRYFPLSSRRAHPQSAVAPSVPAVSNAVPAPGSIPIEWCRSPLTSYHALSDVRSVIRTVRKDALFHQLHASQVLLTNKLTLTTIPLDSGLLSAFQTVCHGGRVSSFAGDSSGWFYSSVVGDEREGMVCIDGWQRQFHLSSEVSSIVVSDTACVATSFGPECKILYAPLDNPVQGTHVLSIASGILHDIWTADLQGSSLALGAHKQAVMIEDIAVSSSLQRLRTHSDVLALAQRENVLYTGLRNGGILRFDTRLRGSCPFPLLDNVTERRGSITALKHLRDYQLLVSFIDGGISTFDLRFPIQTPSMTFTGNCNTYTVRLPLAIDPYERFLFAAGEDRRIRLWSLTTGGTALHPEGTSITSQTVFQRQFEHRIAALQVVKEREGLCLEVASGSDICKYSLGHRSEIGI